MTELTNRILDTGIVPDTLTAREKVILRHELDSLASSGYDREKIAVVNEQLGTWQEVRKSTKKPRSGRLGRGRQGKGDNSLTFWLNRGK